MIFNGKLAGPASQPAPQSNNAKLATELVVLFVVGLGGWTRSVCVFGAPFQVQQFGAEKEPPAPATTTTAFASITLTKGSNNLVG